MQKHLMPIYQASLLVMEVPPVDLEELAVEMALEMNTSLR
jgi:hypothetical protein